VLPFPRTLYDALGAKNCAPRRNAVRRSMFSKCGGHSDRFRVHVHSDMDKL
jgi:hypothetical protein